MAYLSSFHFHRPYASICPVQLGEDYYSYTEDEGLVQKETYYLEKNKDGAISIDIERRRGIKDETAIYFLKNEQGTFVFKVNLPLLEE